MSLRDEMANIAIGWMVRRRLVSLNTIPVPFARVRPQEVQALDALVYVLAIEAAYEACKSKSLQAQLTCPLLGARSHK
jgi:hypothetical protein